MRRPRCPDPRPARSSPTPTSISSLPGSASIPRRQRTTPAGRPSRRTPLASMSPSDSRTPLPCSMPRHCSRSMPTAARPSSIRLPCRRALRRSPSPSNPPANTLSSPTGRGAASMSSTLTRLPRRSTNGSAPSMLRPPRKACAASPSASPANASTSLPPRGQSSSAIRPWATANHRR